MKAFLNMSLFHYFKHEISEYAREIIKAHMLGVNVSSVLFPCIGVFNKTLALFYKHKIKESLRYLDFDAKTYIHICCLIH